MPEDTNGNGVSRSAEERYTAFEVKSEKLDQRVKKALDDVDKAAEKAKRAAKSRRNSAA